MIEICTNWEVSAGNSHRAIKTLCFLPCFTQYFKRQKYSEIDYYTYHLKVG